MSWLPSMFQRRKKREKQAGKQWPLDQALLKWSKRDHHAIANACAGVVCFGATGSGKSSGPGEAIARAHLLAGFSGMFFAAKISDTRDALELCRQTGRLGDVVPFGPKHPARFNFLDFERSRKGSGGGQTMNIVNLLLEVSQIRERGGKGGGGGDQEFFSNAKKQILNAAVDVLAMGHDRIGVPEIYKLILSAPTSMDMVRSQGWRDNSFLFKCLQAGDKREKSSIQKHDFELAADYWLTEYPQQSDRTRTSITSTVTGVLDTFQRGYARELMCGDTNITPEHICEDGKILIHTMDLKDNDEAGALVQVTWKYMLQKAVERRDVSRHPRPVFFHMDEFQNYITAGDSNFATTCRSSRAALTLLTQNLPTLYKSLGSGDQAKQDVDSLLGNCNLKIFCANGCSTTNLWAAEMIGKASMFRMNVNSTHQATDAYSAIFGSDQSQTSAGWSEQIDFQVQPSEFACLRTGSAANDFLVDAVLFRNGHPFRATGKNYMPLAFEQRHR